MTKPIVIDASVAIKWLLPERDEPDTETAIALLSKIADGEIRAIQPRHWIPDCLGAAIRIAPARRVDMVNALWQLNLEIWDDLATHLRASSLSTSMNHHYYDTLYHAVAFEAGATLVTTDEHYFRKSGHLGNIALLPTWATIH
jgi:predicted nucleic acid-binding protein